MGIGTALTSALLKFRLLIISGFIGIIGSLALKELVDKEYITPKNPILCFDVKVNNIVN